MSLIWHKGHQNPRRERLAWVKCECVFFVVVVFFILGLNVLCYQTTTWSGFCERACKLISFFFFFLFQEAKDTMVHRILANQSRCQ